MIRTAVLNDEAWTRIEPLLRSVMAAVAGGVIAGR
jgi:hypothetical protein